MLRNPRHRTRTIKRRTGLPSQPSAPRAARNAEHGQKSRRTKGASLGRVNTTARDALRGINKPGLIEANALQGLRAALEDPDAETVQHALAWLHEYVPNEKQRRAVLRACGGLDDLKRAGADLEKALELGTWSELARTRFLRALAMRGYDVAEAEESCLAARRGASMDLAKVQALRDTKQLLDDGIITKADFAAKKAELLRHSPEAEPEPEPAPEADPPSEQTSASSLQQATASTPASPIKPLTLEGKEFLAKRIPDRPRDKLADIVEILPPGTALVLNALDNATLHRLLTYVNASPSKDLDCGPTLASTELAASPPPPASAPVENLQAHRISVAAAVALAAAKAVPPGEDASEHPQFADAVTALKDEVTIDEDDKVHLNEYLRTLQLVPKYEAEKLVKHVKRWPRRRKYWPRLRRRICSCCGTKTCDLTKQAATNGLRWMRRGSWRGSILL